MRVVRFSPAASSDLDEIWMYLAEVASPELAYTVNRQLKDQLKMLARWPYLGAVLGDSSNFRKFAVAPYLVFYRPINIGIEVPGSCMGSGDLTEILKEL